MNRSHQSSTRTWRQVVTGWSRPARSIRRRRRRPCVRTARAALVTEGPFSESAEQVVGFYLVESDHEADLRAACERFAARGEHIELRRLAE